MKLPSGWYVILSSDEVSENKPFAFTRFGQALVAWRNENGKVVIFDDACPHRMAQLSLGVIKDSCIVCPFHGFEFNEEGKCTHVPETKAAAPNLQVKKYFTKEENDFIWLWWGDSEPSKEISWFNNIGNEFVYGGFEETWPVNFSRSVENQLDYAHLPYVHKNSIGGKSDVSTKRIFELNENYIKVLLNENNSGAYFEFRFPNIWQLKISEVFRAVIAFVPVDENTTKLYQRTYQSFLNLPFLGKIVCKFLNVFNKKVLAEDKRVVISQGKPNWQNEKLFPSDSAIAYFRKKLTEN
jgi:phenylpropionate dioxygenase-like ring-hydroxylating dioxygenase large terminal subunit